MRAARGRDARPARPTASPSADSPALKRAAVVVGLRIAVAIAVMVVAVIIAASLYMLYVSHHPEASAAETSARVYVESNDMLKAMVFAGFAGIIAAGAIGWLSARSAIRPLGKALELQRRFVQDASHELRTPLTSLRTNLDLLRQAEGNPALPAPARLELLDDVRGQIEELSALVGDLVELARDEPMTRVVGEIDLADPVERAVTRVRRRAQGINFDVSLDPWPVVGDADGLERAVTNLLDNAAKWSPVNGTVTVGLADGVLTVDDEGPGIDPADRPHVFERFYRSDESRAMPGSGLGLAIVRQVIDRHGGEIAVAEAPSGGARFLVRLPGVLAASS